MSSVNHIPFDGLCNQKINKYEVITAPRLWWKFVVQKFIKAWIQSLLLSTIKVKDERAFGLLKIINFDFRFRWLTNVPYRRYYLRDYFSQYVFSIYLHVLASVVQLVHECISGLTDLISYNAVFWLYIQSHYLCQKDCFCCS